MRAPPRSRYPTLMRAVVLSLCALALVACDPEGECEPGAQRCDPARPGVVQGCDCDSRGGELNAGCREDPRWVTRSPAPCRAGEQCFEDGTGGAACADADLGSCAEGRYAERCLDPQTVHGCWPYDGLVSANPDGTFAGIIGERTCPAGWRCVERGARADCELPGSNP